MADDIRPLHYGDTVEIIWPNTPLQGAIGEIVGRNIGKRWQLLLHESHRYTDSAVKLATVKGILEELLKLKQKGLPLRGTLTESGLKHTDPINLTSEANYFDSKPYLFKSISDTGATKSFVKREMCVKGTIVPMSPEIQVRTADGGSAICNEKGLVVIRSNVKGCTEQVQLMGAIVLDFDRALLSGPQLDDLGYYCDYGGGGLRVRRGAYGNSILHLPRLSGEDHSLSVGSYHVELPSGGPVDFGIAVHDRYRLYPIPDDLFVVTQTKAEAHVANVYSSSHDICTLHQILGHPAKHKVRLMWWWETGRMHKKGNGDHYKGWCICCVMAKIDERTPQYNPLTASSELNDVCSVDLKTDLPRTVRGFKHYMVVVEWHSNMIWVWLLKKKSDAMSHFLSWLRMVRTQQGMPMKFVRMDCGENYANIITQYCEANGTEVTANIRAFSRGNPKAEAMIKSVDESRRASMLMANANERDWDFAVANVPSQHNRQPNSVELKRATTAALVKAIKGVPNNDERPRTPIEK